VEETFALLKPETVAEGLVGEIIRRFEGAGLRLQALRLLTVPRPLAEAHYGEEIAQKYGAQVREWLLSYITEGPVVAMVLAGPDAIATVRRLSGDKPCPTECAPGTIRGDLGRDSRAAATAEGRALRNLIHSSDSPEAARREVALWFGAGNAD